MSNQINPKTALIIILGSVMASIVAPIRLTAGHKHVIAIVTPNPIDWKALGADIVKGLQNITVWGLKELVVEVN